MSPQEIQTLKNILGILIPSNVNHLVYIPPSEWLRRAADEMDRKDKIIAEFKELIKKYDV